MRSQMCVYVAVAASEGYGHAGRRVRGDERSLCRPYMEEIPMESSVMPYLRLVWYGKRFCLASLSPRFRGNVGEHPAFQL